MKLYWQRYWESLDMDEREKLADLLLDRDSGERDWIIKNQIENFPKYIRDVLIPPTQYGKRADRGQ